MTRLADRMLLKCYPARPSLMEGRSAINDFLREEFLKQQDGLHGQSVPDLETSRARFYANEPVAKIKFQPDWLDKVPIFAADDVATYTSTLPLGTDFAFVVSSMAPPFDKFFIEFQQVPNTQGLHAWGVLAKIVDHKKVVVADKKENGFVDRTHPDSLRWLLQLETFMEREKGKPFGPVACHYLGLAEDGTWCRHDDGANFWGGGFHEIFDREVPFDVEQDWGDKVAQLLFPALLTISFLHCKNVQVRRSASPAEVSHRYLRKHGHDLVRYHVLDIRPMKQILERYRQAGGGDLRNALHICRGHFKTFTADAPLLGKHEGTFWWAPQIRSKQSERIVLKDYRVVPPSEIGRTYREANEDLPDGPTDATAAKDPDNVGRGLVAHNKTQNIIAEIIRRIGWMPRSPAAGEPEYDLAWKAGESLFVCEVKSISGTNEERQLRMAVGQVIRYRQKLAAAGHEPVAAVIGLERAPDDQSWHELCKQEGIVIVWPENAEEILRSSAKPPEA